MTFIYGIYDKNGHLIISLNPIITRHLREGGDPGRPYIFLKRTALYILRMGLLRQSLCSCRLGGRNDAIICVLSSPKGPAFGLHRFKKSSARICVICGQHFFHVVDLRTVILFSPALVTRPSV